MKKGKATRAQQAHASRHALPVAASRAERKASALAAGHCSWQPTPGPCRGAQGRARGRPWARCPPPRPARRRRGRPASPPPPAARLPGPAPRPHRCCRPPVHSPHGLFTFLLSATTCDGGPRVMQQCASKVTCVFKDVTLAHRHAGRALGGGQVGLRDVKEAAHVVGRRCRLAQLRARACTCPSPLRSRRCAKHALLPLRLLG